MKFPENLTNSEQAAILSLDIKSLTGVDVRLYFNYYNGWWELSTKGKLHLEIKDILIENGYVIHKNSFEQLYLAILPTQLVIDRIETS